MYSSNKCRWALLGVTLALLCFALLSYTVPYAVNVNPLRNMNMGALRSGWWVGPAKKTSSEDSAKAGPPKQETVIDTKPAIEKTSTVRSVATESKTSAPTTPTTIKSSITTTTKAPCATTTKAPSTTTTMAPTTTTQVPSTTAKVPNQDNSQVKGQLPLDTEAIFEGKELPTQYTYCYPELPNRDCKKGLKFDTYLVAKYGIDKIGQSLISIQNMTLDQFKSNVPMCTGASSNHYAESIGALASLREKVGPTRVIFWDLGLNSRERAELSKICGLELKKFDFSRWPGYVRNLHLYAWKPLIMLLSLQDNPGVMWFDSSVQFPYKDFWEKSYEQVMHTGGIIHYAGGHKFPNKYTDPHMLEYLPSDSYKFSKVRTSGEGGVIMYFKTRKVFENVLYWYWLCTLTPDCLSPQGSSLYAGKNSHLHRYDQSILGILNENLFNFVPLDYVIKDQLKVARGQRKKVSDVKWCDPAPTR